VRKSFNGQNLKKSKMQILKHPLVPVEVAIVFDDFVEEVFHAEDTVVLEF